MVKIRYRKVRGKHRMYSPELKRKMVLGPGQKDGDIMEFEPHNAPLKTDQSWVRLDKAEDTVRAEVEEAGGGDKLVLVDHNNGWFGVKNTETGEFINTSNLRKPEAEALLTSYQDEEEGKNDPDPVCPVDEGVFGEDYDEFDECDKCEFAEKCEAFEPEEKDDDEKK